MKLKDIGEFGLIRLMSRRIPHYSNNVIKGIGDDTAVLKTRADRFLLMTTDMLVEDVHFSLRYSDPESVGWKALAVNISDIAAMGGTPLYAVVSLGIPPNSDVDFLDRLYDGLGRCAKQYKTDVVGGDTVKTPDKLVINVAVTGEVEHNRVIYRSGAKPGDIIMVTGHLGNSAAGLYLLGNDVSSASEEYSEALRAHLYPTARLREGRILSSSGYVTSMNDISDGLASELLEICEASGTGCELYEDKIPWSDTVSRVARIAGVSPLNWAVFGGEDFELVFTVDPAGVKSVENLLLETGCVPLSLGVIVSAEKGCILLSDKGGKKPLMPLGYNHFS